MIIFKFVAMHPLRSRVAHRGLWFLIVFASEITPFFIMVPKNGRISLHSYQHPQMSEFQN